jgi:hypothetical protein
VRVWHEARVLKLLGEQAALDVPDLVAATPDPACLATRIVEGSRPTTITLEPIPDPAAPPLRSKARRSVRYGVGAPRPTPSDVASRHLIRDRPEASCYRCVSIPAQTSAGFPAEVSGTSPPRSSAHGLVARSQDDAAAIASMTPIQARGRRSLTIRRTCQPVMTTAVASAPARGPSRESPVVA